MANVAVDLILHVIACFIGRVIYCVVEHVVCGLIGHVLRDVAGAVVGSVVTLLSVLSGAPLLRGRLAHGPAPRRIGAARQAEQRGAVPQALRHAGREELPARVAELVEDQHEKDADGVGYQQLHHQQRGADEIVEVCSVDVPHEEQQGVLHKPQHVVHGHAEPVLRLVDEVGVVEFHLHARPAEHVDAGVQEGEHEEHGGGAHLGQSLFYVFGDWRVAPPEQDPGVEEENQEVEHDDGQDPELQHGREQNQDGHARGDLKAPPQENAQVGDGPDVHLVVVVLDLDGQDVAAQRSVHDRQEGDHHQRAWEGNAGKKETTYSNAAPTENFFILLTE